MKIKAKSAKGVTGLLCRSIDGKYFFRVYDSNGSFVDYELAHSDLEITISIDSDATFYENDDGKLIIDHSPETLGLSIKEE